MGTLLVVCIIIAGYFYFKRQHEIESTINYNELQESDISVLACGIDSFSREAYIFYSYQLSSNELLAIFKQQLGYFHFGMHDHQLVVSDLGELILNNRYLKNECTLIESKEYNFSALVFPITVLKTEETSDEWQAHVEHLATLTAVFQHFNEKFRISGATMEQIRILDTSFGETKGFRFSGPKMAKAFKSAVVHRIVEGAGY